MFNRIWISYIAAFLLVVYYFILGVPNTWIQNLFVWTHTYGFVAFVITYNLIILCVLLTMFLSRWITNKFILIALPFLLWVLFYFKIIPRVIL